MGPTTGMKRKPGMIAAACLVAAISASILFSLANIQAYMSDVYDDALGIGLAEGYTIDAVEVFVTAPETGIVPDTVASAADTGFAISAVTWDPAHDPFQAGLEYTASVTLTAAGRCLFADILETASINGHAAAVTGNTGTQVTLAYTFEATILPVTAFAAQTAFCTAAGNQVQGRAYHVAAPADKGTTFTLDTTTTVRANNGAHVTNVDNTPGVSFEYTGANGLLASASSPDKAVINIPAGFVGDVDVTVHAEKCPSENVGFTLVIRSVEDTVANTDIPAMAPWAANIHNAVFVAGDWEWRVLDKGLGAGGNNEALVMSMHTHDAFKSQYNIANATAPAYRDSPLRAHVKGHYDNNPVFGWAHCYSVEPNKAPWAQTSFPATTVETASSGTLTKDTESGHDGCFLLTRNDLSITARGFIATGYGTNVNQHGTAQPSRQFTKTDGSTLPFVPGSNDNAHFWMSTHWDSGTGQELNSNGGWGTGQTDARRYRFYMPAMIIRYNTRIVSAAVTVPGPVAGGIPDTSAPAGGVGYTCGGVTWGPAHSPFMADVPYAASVTLTAENGYVFADTLQEATINGHKAAVTNNTGAQATLSYTFTVYRLEENYGPASGGNAISIFGIDFGTSNTAVTIGGRPCAIASAAPTGYSLECIVPAGHSGPADVRIVDEKGVVTFIEGGYTWRPAVTDISPDCGPTSGGTGYGAGHDPDGRIAIGGAGFLPPSRIPEIDPDFVTANAQDGWVNPKFASAAQTSPANDPFGGAITSTGTVYSSRAAYRLFDKNYASTSSGNWQATVNGSPNITATYTLPTGKYVNIKGILMYNGYYSPVKEVEFFAGSDIDGKSLTGIFQTNKETSTTAYTQYNVPVLANDIWTNQITVKIYPPAWLNPSWTSIQELAYSGRCLDLAPLGLADWPTSFTMEDITPVCSIGTVTIGGIACEWEVVSDSEIVCKPPASALPGNGEGTAGVILSTALGADAIVLAEGADKYMYMDEAGDGPADEGGAGGEAADEGETGDGDAGETGDGDTGEAGDGHEAADETDGGDGAPSADEAGDNAFAGGPGDDAFAGGPDGGDENIDETSTPKSGKEPTADGAKRAVPIALLIIIALLALAAAAWLSARRYRRQGR